MQVKKILIATGIYPPDIGGPATYSKILNDELPKHGVSVSVLSFGEVRSMPKVIRHFVYLFLVLARGRGMDLIFAQDPVSVGLPALLAARILRVKFALKVVGDYAWEQGSARFGVTELLDDFWESSRPRHIFVRLFQSVESFVGRRADIIIVPSKYLKKVVIGWGVPRDKIHVVYNSFDGRIENTGETQKTEKIIVSAGRLVPWKGFVTLIAVMPPLLKHFPDVKLIIAGEGPDRAMLERSIRELNLKSSVFLVGGLSKEKLFKYIKGATLFALNTSYEGFSHQLLEVMALGTPIVTTTAGGNPEIIRNEENGLLVEPDNRDALTSAIERLLVDDDLAFQLSQKAKETAITFTSERMITETIRALSPLL